MRALPADTQSPPRDAPLSPECVSLIFVTEYRLPIIFCSAFEITILQLGSDKGWPRDIICSNIHIMHHDQYLTFVN